MAGEAGCAPGGAGPAHAPEGVRRDPRAGPRGCDDMAGEGDRARGPGPEPGRADVLRKRTPTEFQRPRGMPATGGIPVRVGPTPGRAAVVPDRRGARALIGGPLVRNGPRSPADEAAGRSPGGLRPRDHAQFVGPARMV